MSGAPSPFSWLPGGVENAEPSPEDQIAMNAAMQTEAANAMREQARLFMDVLYQGRGPELLQHLRDRTIEVPLLVINGVVGEREVGMDPAQWAYYREGQNSIVRYLETMIRWATANATEEKDLV